MTQSDPKAMIVGLFDRSAPTYDSVGVDFFTPMGRDLVTLAGLRVGERVLDLGTGRGAVLFAARAAVGRSGTVTGIDLAAGMVDRVRAEAAARGFDNVTVAVGDAEDPAFPPDSFDAIFGGLVVFFVAEPAAVVRRYASLLAPGGRLAFSTFGPQDPSFDAAMEVLGGFADGPLPNRSDRQGPFGGPETIRDLLGAASYTDIRIEERTYESRFRDSEHWLQWVWSHGGRLVLERITEEARPAAAAAAAAALQPARAAGGGYLIHTGVRFTVAQPSARSQRAAAGN